MVFPCYCSPALAVHSWGIAFRYICGVLSCYSFFLCHFSTQTDLHCFWLLRLLYSAWSTVSWEVVLRQRAVGLSSVLVLYLLFTVLKSVASYILSCFTVVSGTRANSIKLLLHGWKQDSASSSCGNRWALKSLEAHTFFALCVIPQYHVDSIQSANHIFTL